MSSNHSLFPDSGLNIPMPNRGNRSISFGHKANRAYVVAADSNTVIAFDTSPLPPPESVDVKAELADLRALVAHLATPEPDKAKLGRALDDATDEAAKPDPDREELGGALIRVGKIVRAADNLSEHIEKLAPRVAALASWLGPVGKAVLAHFGMRA